APSSDDVDTSTFAPDDTERLDRIFDVKGIVGSGFLENSGRTLVLTTSNNQTSAMWAKEKLDFRKKFNIQAYVYLGNERVKAADGLTLTFQGSGRKFIGKSGSGLGAYGAGGMNNISLEIDTYLNQDGYDEYLDSSFQQHIAIVDSWIDSSQKRHDAAERIRVGTSEGKYNNVGISNGQWHSLNVLWNPETSELSYELLMKEVLVNPGNQHIIVRDRVIKNKKKILYPERFYGGAYWGFTAATGIKAARHAIAIKHLPQNLKIETKNSTLYVGQEWRASDNFVSATDLSGNSVSFDSSLITVDGDVDTSKPGTHKIKYTIEEEGIRKDSECTVEVKEDKTSLELNTGTHY
ncbi:lectin-like domain-containing protein, partial [Enterococcus faecalis]|uniref:lectin-like domain-containing protein n=1 Tax=Enterococcus faecalis TaxID=1351 RepID=UPI0031CD1EC6